MAGAIIGVPRSGTSLTMNLSAKSVGIERIIGKKFMRLDAFEQMKKQGENETDHHFAMRQYILDGNPKFSEEAIKKHIKMNPNGFYEHPQFTCTGIRYRPELKEDIEKLDNEDENNPYVIKLVNSGLANSDPKYIDWGIYMLRHPLDVAKSQENLNRSRKFILQDGRKVDLYEGQKVNDVKFFIESTIMAAKWMSDNPRIPVLFVKFDELIEKPDEKLKRMEEFTGIPYTKVTGIIQQKLRRSKVDHTPKNKLEEEAIEVYNMMVNQEFEKIVEFSKRKDTWTHRRRITIFCPRTKGPKSYANCYTCNIKEDENFIKSSIKYAEDNKIDWKNEPCPFECGFDPDYKTPKTIKESIKNNHWAKV